MSFKQVLAQIISWLQQDKRVAYRALKRQFDLNGDDVGDLKEAFLYAHPRLRHPSGIRASILPSLPPGRENAHLTHRPGRQTHKERE